MRWNMTRIWIQTKAFMKLLKFIWSQTHDVHVSRIMWSLKLTRLVLYNPHRSVARGMTDLLSGGPVVGATACGMKPRARRDSTHSRSADGSIDGSFDCRWNGTRMGHRGRQIERWLSGEVTHSSSGKTPLRMTNHSGWWEIKTLLCVTPST